MEREIVKMQMERDFAQFRELSLACFGEGSNLDEAMHKWLLDENPYNSEGNLLFLLKEGDRAIGCDGLIPFKLKIRDKIVSMAFSVKSMTHPDFQRQGIFRKMTENSVASGKNAGIDVILGLANGASYPAYQKFGWSTLFEKEVMVRPIHIKKILKRKLKVAPLAELGDWLFAGINKLQLRHPETDFSFAWHDQVPEEVQNCWDRYHPKFEVLQVRDYKYLNYRYNKRPDVRYKTLLVRKKDELIGFVILRESKTANSVFGSVAEFFTDPFNESFIDAMAKEVSRFAYERDLDYLVLSCGEYGRFVDVLSKNGYHRTPKPPSNNMTIARILSDNVSLEDLGDGSNWHVTQGEGDTELDL